jgi:AbrB family looped-hinge helix DNA binding protein
METVVSKRGQTSVPAEIRRRHGIQEGDTLVWIDDGCNIYVVPVPADPLSALRGSAKGENLLEMLLEERRRDRERE